MKWRPKPNGFAWWVNRLKFRMKKKNIYGDGLREQLKAGARDKMHFFLLVNHKVRGAVLQGTKLVNEMRANHDLEILETLILGHAYMGALLMSSNLKGKDRIIVKIKCEGPAKGLTVEANSFGEVRGYLAENRIPLDRPLETFDMAPFIGKGIITVTRILEKARQPYTGQIELEYGNIAEDFANFCLKSEQIPSAFDLSVKFDKNGTVTGSGGLMLQTMPGADIADITQLENRIRGLPSLGELFSGGDIPDEFILREFSDFQPIILFSKRVEFMCHCSRNRFQLFLEQLPQSDLKDMAENGPFPLVLTCINCNSQYHFNQLEMEGIYGEVINRN